MIRNHVAWAADAARAVAAIPGCTVVTGPSLALFTFAFRDDAATEALLRRINDDGRLYLTQTRHDGRYPDPGPGRPASTAPRMTSR